jgi:hypothetical protein
MKRSRRIVDNAVTIFSVTLFLSTAALWAWSFYTPSLAIAWGNSSTRVGRLLSAYRGFVLLRSDWATRPMRLDNDTRAFSQPLLHFNAWGFSFFRNTWIRQTTTGAALQGSFGTYQETSLSLAWPLVASMASSIYLLRRRAARGVIPGICRICGYDLRATPDRCPECGTIPLKSRGE